MKYKYPSVRYPTFKHKPAKSYMDYLEENGYDVLVRNGEKYPVKKPFDKLAFLKSKIKTQK